MVTAQLRSKKVSVRPRPTIRKKGVLGGNFKLIVILLVAIIAVSTLVVVELGSSQRPKATIIDWDVFVYAGTYNATHFSTPASMTNIHAKGSFNAIGGNGEILVLLVSDYDYQTYLTVGSSPPGWYYNSGSVHAGSFDALLPSDGSFWIVFWDKFQEGRVVSAHGFLYY